MHADMLTCEKTVQMLLMGDPEKPRLPLTGMLLHWAISPALLHATSGLQTCTKAASQPLAGTCSK